MINVFSMFLIIFFSVSTLILFRKGFFGAPHGWRVARKFTPIPKICHTYPATMKGGTVIPHAKKIQKVYESRDTLLGLCSLGYAFFHRKSANFVISSNTDIDCILIHKFYLF